MAWRTVVISNPARLKVENDQLLIEQEDAFRLPLEDIGVLLLESQQVVLSAALLSRLADHDVMLLACDGKHLPNMAGLPFARHSRLAAVQRIQINLTLPFQKRCWQSIIKQKIENHAFCLQFLSRPGVRTIRAMSSRVTSGDAENTEASAAREYFRCLFGPHFMRGFPDPTNSALDYGYAILRAAVARALVSHGFLPALGIHHHSELNQFNLADDFLEPLRPLVDLRVAGMSLQAELTKSDREKLVALLHADLLIDGKKQQALQAVEIMAASFLSACREKNHRLLKLPRLMPITIHRYE